MRGISCYLTVTLVVIDPVASICGAVPWLERCSLIRGGGRTPERDWGDKRKRHSGIIPDKRKRRSISKDVSSLGVNLGGRKGWNERDDIDEEDDGDDDWVEERNGEEEDEYDNEEDEDHYDKYDYGGSPPISVKEKLSAATESIGNRVLGAKHKAEKLYREAHTLLSSDMESVLLKATRPDNDPAESRYCDGIVEACSRYMTVSPKGVRDLSYEQNPYEQLLRKLARIVAEKDWRTTAKALYLTHRLATEISDDSWAYLHKTYISLMSASRLGTSHSWNSHHSSSHKDLFSRQSAISLSPSGECYAPVLDAYSQLVRARLYSFSPSLSELSLGHANLASITQAENFIEAALTCSSLLEDGFDNNVMVDCLQLCVRDLVKIWAAHEVLVGDALNDSPNGIRDGQAQLQCCVFHVSNFDLVGRFVRRSHRLLAHYAVKSPTDLKSTLKPDAIHAKIKQLSRQ